MLQNIYVKNMALIEEAEVSLSGHLNILTGETGAGKSIIIGSVSMALGAKAAREVIRKGTEYALAELTFVVDNPQIREKLEALEIPMEDGTVVISRRMTKSRSISRINGELVSLQEVRQAAELLIDIHGQHAHQSLLHKEKHLDILDQFARTDIKEKKAAVKAAFDRYNEVQKQLSEAVTDENKRQGEMDYLEFQINEITEAALTPGEDEAVEQTYRKMSNAVQILSGLSQVYQMTGDEQNDGAGNMIGSALRQMSSLEKYDAAIGSFSSQLSEVEALLNDFNREMADYLEGLNFDEQEYHEIEQRMMLIQRLKSKYGQTAEEILAYGEKCQQTLEQFMNYEAYLEELRSKNEVCENALIQACSEVTAVRSSAAAVLETQIAEALCDLNFLDVQFKIDVRPLTHFTTNGRDEVEFMISLNPGEELSPLGKVASGGELSRIMLAVKSVLADSDDIDTLIFDEIDTGISGRTAQKVSEKMTAIADKHQVICITHLPQIAAMADAHYVIEKKAENGRALTQISKLTEAAAVEEIARLLGGVEITAAVRENAGEMKRMAGELKQH